MDNYLKNNVFVIHKYSKQTEVKLCRLIIYFISSIYTKIFVKIK